MLVFTTLEMIKFTAIGTFIDMQTLYFNTLYAFVMFQQIFRLERLPIEKNAY